jgi:hypothetical protein
MQPDSHKSRSGHEEKTDAELIDYCREVSRAMKANGYGGLVWDELLLRFERSRTFTVSETASRNDVIEEIASEIEKSPLTYAGPDPQSIRALHTLMVQAIRDMKGKP